MATAGSSSCLAKLRGALTGEAKPSGQRPSVDRIFVALRDRFGITALDARLRLQRLLRKEDTPSKTMPSQ